MNDFLRFLLALIIVITLANLFAKDQLHLIDGKRRIETAACQLQTHPEWCKTDEKR